MHGPRLLTGLFLLLALGCGGEPPPGVSEASPAEPAAAAGTAGPAAIAPHPVEGPSSPIALLEPWHGDWQGMVDDRVVRVLVAYNRTHFFLDGARQRGIIADALQELERHLNGELGLGARRLHLAPVPVHRDQLIPFLEQGRGDFAAANLTITSEREGRVDFSIPLSEPIDELVVTGPGGPKLGRLEDLAGRQVHVRRSSSFWNSLERLNASFRSRGLAPVEAVPADEALETEDLLELTSAGLVPITIADSHMAAFWGDVLPDLVVHESLKVSEGARIAWAIRPDAGGLKAKLDPWIERNRQGHLLGNMLLKRYLRENRWVRSPSSEHDEARFLALLELFERYGARYGFDPLLIAAQGYQESGLDHSRRSHAGAVGVMQVLPSTARDPAVGIEDLEDLESNVHAGTRYLRHVVDRYFDEPGIDGQNRLLFAFAAYNAGPTRIRRLRGQAEAEGLDPNVWFRNVELVVAKKIGRETVQYVANIYKYHVAFELLLAQERARERARAKLL